MHIILVPCSRPSLWASHISQPTCPRPWPLIILLLSLQRCSPGSILGSVSWHCWLSHTFPKYRAGLRQSCCFVLQGAAEALASPETRFGALGNTVQKCGGTPPNWASWDKWETGDKSLAFSLFLMAVSMCLGSYTTYLERPHVDNSQLPPWSYEQFGIGNTHLVLPLPPSLIHPTFLHPALLALQCSTRTYVFIRPYFLGNPNWHLILKIYFCV